MLATHMKLVIVLFLGFAFFVFGCNGLVEDSQGNLSIRGFLVRAEISERQELANQLQKFAEEFEFSFLIREVRVLPDGIYIYMARDDLKITAVSDGGDPTLLDFTFHEQDPDRPTPNNVVEEIFNSLKNFLVEVPGIMIIEEQ